MKLNTPRSEQGQIIERAYGWHEGKYYCRVIDRSGPTTTWARADDASRDRLADSSYDAGGDDDAPSVTAWVPCRDPQPDEPYDPEEPADMDGRKLLALFESQAERTAQWLNRAIDMQAGSER